MQIAICDDEKEIRQMLAEKVGKLYPQAFLSLYESGEVLGNAVRQVQEEKDREREKEKKETPGLLVQTGGQHIFVRLEEIVYAEVFNRKIMLHTLDGDIEYYGKMKELEEKAGENFYRPHRAYLVNLAFVRKYDAATIYLEKGQALMAKQNYPEFVKRYLRYTLRTSRI